MLRQYQLFKKWKCVVISLDKYRNIKIKRKKWVELDIFNIDCTAFLENQFVNKKLFWYHFTSKH